MAVITLRAIEKEDLELIRDWRNSSNVMPYCRQYRPLSMADMLIWYNKIGIDEDYNLTNDLFIICLEGISIGVGGFVRIDYRNRKAELSFYVGEDGARTEENIIKSLDAILYYGFATLGLWKIYFPCYSFNPFIKIYEKVMSIGYIARKEYFWKGKYWDRIVMEKFNEYLPYSNQT